MLLGCVRSTLISSVDRRDEPAVNVGYALPKKCRHNITCYVLAGHRERETGFILLEWRRFEGSTTEVMPLSVPSHGGASADDIAQVTFRQYAELPQRGKPVGPYEWTVLAAFVVEDTHAGTLKVSVAWPKSNAWGKLMLLCLLQRQSGLRRRRSFLSLV